MHVQPLRRALPGAVLLEEHAQRVHQLGRVLAVVGEDRAEHALRGDLRLPQRARHEQRGGLAVAHDRPAEAVRRGLRPARLAARVGGAVGAPQRIADTEPHVRAERGAQRPVRLVAVGTRDQAPLRAPPRPGAGGRAEPARGAGCAGSRRSRRGGTRPGPPSSGTIPCSESCCAAEAGSMRRSSIAASSSTPRRSACSRSALIRSTSSAAMFAAWWSRARSGARSASCSATSAVGRLAGTRSANARVPLQLDPQRPPGTPRPVPRRSATSRSASPLGGSGSAGDHRQRRGRVEQQQVGSRAGAPARAAAWRRNARWRRRRRAPGRAAPSARAARAPRRSWRSRPSSRPPRRAPRAGSRAPGRPAASARSRSSGASGGACMSSPTASPLSPAEASSTRNATCPSGVLGKVEPVRHQQVAGSRATRWRWGGPRRAPR